MIGNNEKISLPLASLLILLGFLIAVAFCFFLIYENGSLRNSIATLTASQAQLEKRVLAWQENYNGMAAKEQSARQSLAASEAKLADSERLRGDANDRISALSQQLAQNEQKLSQYQSDLASQKAKADEIAYQLSFLEKNISGSISWFRDNAKIPENHSWAAGIFPSRVAADCVDAGRLNLACISYIMENTAFAIHYRTDVESTGKADFLQSLNYTIDTGWGDCEDYSLLFKATLNTLRDRRAGLVPVAFAGGGTSDFRVYPKESLPTPEVGQYWYVPNAQGVQLGSLDELHAYVVCYTKDSSGGHCTVALTENNITSSKDIGLLSGARVFEPQIGVYLGTIGNEFGICDAPGCEYTPKAVRLVIADGDLYLYQSGQGWTGYEDYLKKVQDAKKEFGAA